MENKKRSRFLHDYGLSVALACMFLVSWIGQGIFQWIEFARDEQDHGQTATAGSFVAPFLGATFENWQSEFLQVFTFVIMTACLYHKGSHESKDNDEENDAALVRIEQRLDFLGARLDKFAGPAEMEEFTHLKQKVDHTRRKNQRATG